MLRTQLLTTISRVARPPTVVRGVLATPFRAYSSEHDSETFEAFTERYIRFFEGVDDVFELQRGLNNCFAYDLVPAPSVIESALKASRRVNDYSTAVRIFEGIKEKVENDRQYKEYLQELKDIKEKLGVLTKEELGF